MATPAGCLYGDGVPDDLLARTAARHGLDLAKNGTKPSDPGQHNVLLMSKVELDHLARWIASPFSAYIEVIDGEPDQLNPETVDSIKGGRLCFSLATDTAYKMDSAALVCDALSARGVLSPIRRQDVELSLHETISNAVVHGNLGIESAKKGNIESFSNFAVNLMENMNKPEAKRRIDISAAWDSEFLDISVSDKGRGYDETKLPVNDPFAPAGRGLAIIRSLTLAMNVTNGGRVTTLRFLT